jgi:hypothetical protein
MKEKEKERERERGRGRVMVTSQRAEGVMVGVVSAAATEALGEREIQHDSMEREREREREKEKEKESHMEWQHSQIAHEREPVESEQEVPVVGDYLNEETEVGIGQDQEGLDGSVREGPVEGVEGAACAGRCHPHSRKTPRHSQKEERRRRKERERGSGREGEHLLLHDRSHRLIHGHYLPVGGQGDQLEDVTEGQSVRMTAAAAAHPAASQRSLDIHAHRSLQTLPRSPEMRSESFVEGGVVLQREKDRTHAIGRGGPVAGEMGVPDVGEGGAERRGNILPLWIARRRRHRGRETPSAEQAEGEEACGGEGHQEREREWERVWPGRS